jgi:GntR family transcriptional regulator, rspAB operon transcriptional repressor
MPNYNIPKELLSLSSAESVSAQIYRKLRKLIINSTFTPGERIVDKEIAELFGVSKQPIRDAFSRLAEARLLKILPQRGTFVMKISPREVESGQFIREAVEVAIARRVAETSNEETLRALYKNLVEQAAAAKMGDIPHFLDLDEEFHCILAMSIGCVAAWNAIENIKASMDRVRYLSLKKESPPETIVEQHVKIAESIKSRNPDAAEKAVRNHLRGIFFSLAPIVDKNPEWFEDE